MCVIIISKVIELLNPRSQKGIRKPFSRPGGMIHLTAPPLGLVGYFSIVFTRLGLGEISQIKKNKSDYVFILEN